MTNITPQVNEDASTALESRSAEPRRVRNQVFRPRCDVVESDASVVLWAEMPGVEQSGVEIELEADVLTIRGRSSEGAERGALELELGDYARSFQLSDAIDRESITAQMKQGLLRVDLPKRVPAKRTIDVAAG